MVSRSEGDRAIHLPKVKATDDPPPSGRSMGDLLVKLRDTEAAGKQIKPILKEGSAVISLQNGVQKDDIRWRRSRGATN